MRRLMAAVLALMVLVVATQASARRFKLPRMIPIPGGTHVNGILLKVQDLPSQFEHEGRHYDLGYYWPRSGTPGWVGYLSSREYLSGRPGVIEDLVQGEGISLPEVPERPDVSTSSGISDTSGGASFIWIFVIIGVLTGLRWLVVRSFKTAVAGVVGLSRVGAAKTEPEIPAWQLKAEAQMATTSGRAAAPRVGPRIASAAVPNQMRPQRAVPERAIAPRGLAAAGPKRQGFGRR